MRFNARFLGPAKLNTKGLKMDYQKEKDLEKQARLAQLAQYAANLAAIHKYLHDTRGSSDASNQAFKIYCELDNVINQLIKERESK